MGDAKRNASKRQRLADTEVVKGSHEGTCEGDHESHDGVSANCCPLQGMASTTALARATACCLSPNGSLVIGLSDDGVVHVTAIDFSHASTLPLADLASRCLTQRIQTLPGQSPAPHCWDVFAACADLPRSSVRDVVWKIAATLDAHIAALWPAPCATRLEPPGELCAAEKKDGGCATRAVRKAAQLHMHAPRAAMMLAALADCVGGGRNADAGRLTAALWLVYSRSRLHARSFACARSHSPCERSSASIRIHVSAHPHPFIAQSAELVTDELDCWGAAIPAASTGADETRTLWSRMAQLLSGNARLSTMSERRLVEIYGSSYHVCLPCTALLHMHAHVPRTHRAAWNCAVPSCRRYLSYSRGSMARVI